MTDEPHDDAVGPARTRPFVAMVVLAVAPWLMVAVVGAGVVQHVTYWVGAYAVLIAVCHRAYPPRASRPLAAFRWLIGTAALAFAVLVLVFAAGNPGIDWCGERDPGVVEDGDCF